MLLGIDCAAPSLAFDACLPVMPNLASMMREGIWGPLRSVVPPVTVPAWACMTSGRDPGELGLYGFKNRVRGRYETSLATGLDVKVDSVWDLAERGGRRAAALFVPPSYPLPATPSIRASCFLTPSAESPWVRPPSLRESLTARCGPYRVDVEGYRERARHALLADVLATTTQRFAMAESVWRDESPDLLAMVDISTDRFHHAFWSTFSPDHRRFDPDHPFRDSAARHYGNVDACIGRMLAAADDDTTVIVASDHGARSLEGAIALNEWLMREGHLVLLRAPVGIEPVTPALVDWDRTRAWGDGGYHGRVYLNVRGREPRGIVAPEEVPELLDRMTRALASIGASDGSSLGTRIERPDRIYRATRGLAPDLMVFFGDLRYRAAGTVGHGAIHLAENDTGADDANHDWEGIFAARGPDIGARGRSTDLSIHDVGPTMLAALGIDSPPDWLGTVRR